MKTELTHERLQQLLSYCPETGVFRWRVNQGAGGAGREAGSWRGSGYRSIAIEGRRYLAHRLAWFYVYGEHPPSCIDHKNGDPADNSIANLRPSSALQSRWNCGTRNKWGFTGVKGSGSKWEARISVNGKKRSLGRFGTPAEAGAAYIGASLVLHGEFAVVNRRRWARSKPV